MNSPDERRYSRQLYVFGKEPMIRFIKTKVLLSGLGGLGVEIAKNLILGGIKSLTIHDSKNCSWSDLSSHFFLTEKNIGENRAKSCLAHLRLLNPENVSLEMHTGELSMPFISNFKMIVCTEGQQDGEKGNLSDFCHDNGIFFIMAETRGLFSRVFCDFGENFVVGDPDGKEPQKISIRSISKELHGIVTCDADDGHELQTGDTIVINDVKGMAQLNGLKIIIRTINSHQFSIGNTTDYSDYVSGGYIKKEMQGTVKNFDSLIESIANPMYILPDGAKPENPLQIHLAFQAFDAFFKKMNRMPNQWDNDDLKLMLKEANLINYNAFNKDSSLVDNINFELMGAFSFTCTGNISPMNSLIGGIVAQEVMKAASERFCPLFQWLFFDAMECIDIDSSRKSPKEYFHQPKSRYSGQISIFGKHFQEKLSNLKVFVVGAGAIGCELLKNMALMGIGTGSQGKITVTDMDFIEKSNLCRQLLYRDTDIGKPKSIVAAEAVRRINSQVKIEAHENEVGVESENIYHEEFYVNLDLIANALDNIPARKYMDKMCVQYRKPLLESGTSGTMGNSQVIVPFYSQCYRDKGNPRQKVIPMCTLKHFPYQIAHTIQWARELFEDTFVLDAKNACSYLNGKRIWEEDSATSENLKLMMVDSIQRFFGEKRPREFLDCIQLARYKFDQLFINNIQQLLHNFPKDHLDKRGCLFWSGYKRCPKPRKFCIDDDICFNFVFSASNLFAEVFGIAQVPYQEAVYILLRKIEDEKNTEDESDFVPIKFLHIDDGEDEELKLESISPLIEDEVEEIVSSLPLPSELSNVKIRPLSFEKDGDNFHIDFITAASNLRALCYSIDPVDALRTKQIAGNIIPAIATSTSVAAGLVCFELYKLFLDREFACPNFKDCFFNLAVPLISFTGTSKANKITCSNGFTWNLWSRFDVHERDCNTLGQFMEHFRKMYNLEISVLSFGPHLLYYSWMSDEMRNSILSKNIKEVVAGLVDQNMNAKKSLQFEIRCSNLSEKDELPPVVYLLKK